MAKVTNPLFSGDVSGKFGSQMIYRRGGVVTRVFSPRNPRTIAQQANRQAFKDLYMASLTQAQADLLYAAIVHLHDDRYSLLDHLHEGGSGGGAFQRDLTAELILNNGECLVLTEFIYPGNFDITLHDESTLHIL